MKQTLGIAIIAIIICSTFTAIPFAKSATSYRDAYSGSININWLEYERQRNPNFNPFYFTGYVLSQINSKYGVSFNYIKLDFELTSTTDYTTLINQMNYYVPTFAQYFSQKLIIQLSGIRSTHQLLTQQQANSLYSQIASILNPHSSKIIVFAGENELEGNTTCPLCGAIGGQVAFNNNVTAMIEYAKLLYGTWKQYSTIPFTHSAVAPWHHNIYTVYDGFWFGSMAKNTYLNYINQTQDILAWTVWWNTDGAQYLGTLRSQLGKQVIIAEHNFHNPSHAIGIMNNFGIANVIAFSWYCLVGTDIQVLYDWACEEHNVYKHSWFPMAKVATASIPQGNYFGVMNTWHDLSLQGYQNAWSAYVNTYVYAQRSFSISTVGYDAFECFANFEAVATQTGDIEFMTVGTSDSKYYTIGAQIYTDRTFRIFFKYITAGGGSFTVYYGARDLTYMNTWWKLRIYHNRGTIWFIINDQLWLAQGNSDISSRTFTSVTFGDRSATVASKIYLDHFKLWTSSDGSNWYMQFEEQFENNLNGWTKYLSPTTQPSFIDTTNGFYLDYASIYAAHQIS